MGPELRRPDAGTPAPDEPPKRKARIDDDMEVMDFEPCAVLSELAFVVAALEGRRADVAELFGPGRFTSKASIFDLVPGTAMDLRTGFDFSKDEDRERTRAFLDAERPALLIGSPKCVAFSCMQNLRKNKDDLKPLIQEGLARLEFTGTSGRSGALIPARAPRECDQLEAPNPREGA